MDWFARVSALREAALRLSVSERIYRAELEFLKIEADAKERRRNQ